MKYGINTLLWTAAFDSSHLHLLPQFRAKGFDGVEIARFDFSGFPAAEIRRACEREGLATIFCSALTGDLSLVSQDDNVRRRAREFLLAGIETAASIGADTFVGPFCSPVGYHTGARRTDDEWKRAVDGLQSLTSTLDQYGVTLANEPLNRFETHFLNLTQDAVRLCEEVGHERIGILFDTFHANIEEKSAGAALAGAGRRLKHIHACENDRGIPGSGHIQWPEIFAALERARYDRWIVIESFGSRIPEIAKAACIWRDLAPSSEAIAFEGLTFLKTCYPARP
jgi:D-psicose/D-tagatose/L-ribulose 3-epimerase